MPISQHSNNIILIFSFATYTTSIALSRFIWGLSSGFLTGSIDSKVCLILLDNFIHTLVQVNNLPQETHLLNKSSYISFHFHCVRIVIRLSHVVQLIYLKICLTLHNNCSKIHHIIDHLLCNVSPAGTGKYPLILVLRRAMLWIILNDIAEAHNSIPSYCYNRIPTLSVYQHHKVFQNLQLDAIWCKKQFSWPVYQ